MTIRYSLVFTVVAALHLIELGSASGMGSIPASSSSSSSSYTSKREPWTTPLVMLDQKEIPLYAQRKSILSGDISQEEWLSPPKYSGSQMEFNLYSSMQPGHYLYDGVNPIGRIESVKTEPKCEVLIYPYKTSNIQADCSKPLKPEPGNKLGNYGKYYAIFENGNFWPYKE